jgi:hypothetical protein
MKTGDMHMFSKKLLLLVSAAALTLAGGLAGTPSSIAAPGHAKADSIGKSKHSNSVYIVRMSDAPVAAYDGKIKGYAATRPAKGRKIDPDDANVGTYFEYLSFKHDGALQKAGGAHKLYSYGYVFNGFAAELSDAQAAKLRSTDGVLSVERDEVRQLDTSSTPAFLGLSGPGGFWATTGATGEDVIIGMLDSGIWPEHPSFSDRTDRKGKKGKTYHHIPGWKGKCQKGDNKGEKKGDHFDASNCNEKLIGARFYNAGWGGNAEIDTLFPFEFNSPRDWAGHGTHTSSTAGGNADVLPTGITAPFGPISGIAPRARISVYKVCWADQPTGGGCTTVDMLAGIDQAVADGVDVINFSISGTSTNFRDPVEIAFLFAADAGIFVAASAGNAGPTTSTVAHPSPWLTTVAAGTHNRNGEGSATLGNAATYAGASFASPLASTPLIDSVSAGLTGADPAAVEKCFAAEDNGGTPVLDPAKVAGKIVLCKRGASALVNKSGAVAAAGGAGAIIYNDPVGATSTLALVHAVPTVHVVSASGLNIKAYIASAAAAARASIAQSTIVLNTPAPFTASFSSRGPLLAGNGNLLKPDLIAPGQDILAGVAPPNNSDRLFDLYSGTSMSSPHVAGLGALFKELHPSWSPMMIKSALMTSAGDILDGPNTNPLVIFRQGAGHVQPNRAADPGLVFDSGFTDWLNFICGTQPGSFCSAFTAIDPSNLNVASIAIGAMPGSKTVTRTVTNVGGAAETYTASLTGLAGIAVVLPARMKIAGGAARTFNVGFTTSGAALNSYVGGQFTLTGNLGHVVRIPIVVRPVALAAPTQVSGSYSVTFGYTGSFTATARGLVPAATNAGSISTDEQQVYDVTIPAGTTYARFSLFDANVSPASDLDLYVFNSAFAQIGASGGPTSAEEVNLLNPAAGTYYVLVVGFATANPSTYTLFNWSLGTTGAGNMTVTAPASATQGGTGAINLSFNGLVGGTKYLGSVAYGGAAGLPDPTIVRVDTP